LQVIYSSSLLTWPRPSFAEAEHLHLPGSILGLDALKTSSPTIRAQSIREIYKEGLPMM
jgi:hypothetical protein